MSTSLQYKLHSGKNSKAGYYLKAGFRDFLPDTFFRHQLHRELSRCASLYDGDYCRDRVDYYCKLSEQSPLGPDAAPIGSLSMRENASVYYFDSREILQWFDPQLKWNHLFGDSHRIPEYPTVIKSRDLGCDNSNSVLLKLNKCRHFVFLNDRLAPEEKEDRAIFRGHIGTRGNRAQFCELYQGNPRVDVANTSSSVAQVTDASYQPKLSFYEHLRFRYIIALEGNDVASNLKWIMSSHSAAVMPRPTCETWFMEGRLQPNVHYIEIKPDFSDLEERMDYYSSHLDELNAIVQNANRYVEQFRDHRRERYIGLLVMQKYFRMTNQL